MWLILANRDNVDWLEFEQMHDYLRTRPNWLEQLTDQDLEFLMGLEAKTGSASTASDMAALYLAEVCDDLNVLGVGCSLDFECYIALIDDAKEGEFIFYPDFSQETLNLMEELITSAA